MLAEKVYAKALSSFESCLPVSINLCEKLISFHNQIWWKSNGYIFCFFVEGFYLPNCKSDIFMFTLLLNWVVLFCYYIEKNKQNFDC